MTRSEAQEIFPTAEAAYAYAHGNQMSFTPEGRLITSGCEGISRAVATRAQAAARVIAGELPDKGV